MLNLEGYQAEECLYSGVKTLVYRGKRTETKQPVAIKVLRNYHPSFSELVQFRNQYTIARHLDSPHIVAPSALERYGNGYALIMPDGGAISLAEYWQQFPGNLTEFLAIAIQLADALHYIGTARIIHKDIKPANILIHPETKQVQLIDFSISSLLPKEQQKLVNPNGLEGTMAYISPEQTGRMNRGIDYRTDFYSLGITFYELLTGQLPFNSIDPIELVHCHLAKIPDPIGEQQTPRGIQIDSIPLTIENIVMKLIAKNAEDRYQSALGLKYDLEQCLQQWQERGKIEQFSLGQRDLCDRFTIPERLYGRETEVAQLLAAFERAANGEKEMVLVAGFSGIGKTAVINEVHKPIVKKRGYFIKGKFDQFNRDIPFSAFVQAFRNLMGQLLGESDAQLAEWKAQILDAVGTSGKVLIEVIPELEWIIGEQPPVAELSGSVAQNRFNLLFGKFIQLFTTKDHPLTLFLDDLQWADSASLKLLRVLINQSEQGCLLILGAYRDNEVFPAHPLILALDEFMAQGAKVETITLAPLQQPDITRLVADTLVCSLEIATPLSELVYQKTQGNPFFATQFLQGLHKDDCIQFNATIGCWECNLTEIRKLSLTDDVVQFMVARLQKLSHQTQDLLKLAACIGNQFDLETLATINEASEDETGMTLWSALQEQFIIPDSETYKFFQGEADMAETSKQSHNLSYHFLHDRVQQAAYSLIADDRKPETHFQIGKMLLQNMPESEQEEKIFVLVNQLNYGTNLITERAESDRLARLNAIAGKKAIASTAYGAALTYLNTGIELLAEDSWTTDYDLTLSLYQKAVEAEYLNTHFDRVAGLSEIVLSRATTTLDKANIYDLQIQSYMAENQPIFALEYGLNKLQELGYTLCSVPDSGNLAVELPQITNLDQIPVMSDRSHLAALKLLISISSPAFVAQPETWPAIVLTLVDLCKTHGYSGAAASALALYGTILGGKGQIETGYRAGDLAMKLLEKFDAKPQKCQVYQIFHSHVRPRKYPIAESLFPIRESIEIGLETGDFEWAGYGLTIYCSNVFLAGYHLDTISSDQDKFLDLAIKLKQDYPTKYIQIWKQLTDNLKGLAEDPYLLRGKSCDELTLIPWIVGENNITLLFQINLAKTILLYVLNRSDLAVKSAEAAEQSLSGVTGMIVDLPHNFYYSLSLLDRYNNVPESQQAQWLKQVVKNQKQLQDWAAHSPQNCQHKYDLVAAEYMRVLGDLDSALNYYDLAIDGAQKHGFLHEEALANERAALFYLHRDKEKLAATYMQEAYYGYARWGAKVKTDRLEATYPHLLEAIFPSTESQSLDTPSNPESTISTTLRMSTTNTSSSLLDLASTLKASQAISSEISLESLLSKLMQIVVENAGATGGSLVLNRSGEWEIVVQYLEDREISLCSLPLEPTHLPLMAINTVKRSQTSAIANNVPEDTTLTSDPYFRDRSPLSLLCHPILYQGKLIGILYLENTLTVEAFTPDRLEVLSLLATQAAISLENAQLYHNLEDKVEERTAELSQALHELQTTQNQLVESQKMAALGGLVAGVAHEINTPIGTSIMAASTLADETQAFITTVASGHIKRSSLNDYLNVAAESSQLLLSNLHRAGELVQNFKQIAADSTDLEKRQVRLKEYLQEIATSLTPTLKPTPHELTVSGEEGIVIDSYPGALAQIITNLVTNSLAHAYPSGNPGQLHLQITRGTNKNTVIIEYSDDGCGIQEEIIHQVFEPFFTTARNRGGTGLGLHIVYNLVVQKLQGTIAVDSTVGLGTRLIISLPHSVDI